MVANAVGTPGRLVRRNLTTDNPQYLTRRTGRHFKGTQEHSGKDTAIGNSLEDRFLIFTNATRHCGQRAQKIVRPSLYTPGGRYRFLLGLSESTFGEGTSCHNPYRDIEASANKASANGKTSGARSHQISGDRRRS